MYILFDQVTNQIYYLLPLYKVLLFFCIETFDDNRLTVNRIKKIYGLCFRYNEYLQI